MGLGPLLGASAVHLGFKSPFEWASVHYSVHLRDLSRRERTSVSGEETASPAELPVAPRWPCIAPVDEPPPPG